MPFYHKQTQKKTSLRSGHQFLQWVVPMECLKISRVKSSEGSGSFFSYINNVLVEIEFALGYYNWVFDAVRPIYCLRVNY